MSSASATGLTYSTTQPGGSGVLSNLEVGSTPAGDCAQFVSLATNLLTVIGADGCFKRLSPWFAQAFGYAESELLGQPLIAFVHPDDQAATGDALQVLARGTPTVEFENRFLCNQLSFVCVSWMVMSTAEGLLYAVTRELLESERRTDDSAGSTLPEHADGIARRQQVLSSSYHDMQQPLTVILGQTQVMQRLLARRATLPREQLVTRLGHIVAAVTRLRVMTRDLFDSSLRDSGPTGTLVLARTDLVALAREAVAEHALESRQHTFSFEAPAPTLEAVVDPFRIRRILDNLLTNAVKYSPSGGTVHVTVLQTDGPDGNSGMLVVRDEGVGIPHEDLPHVFDQFHRGANVVGRYAGSGLGLAIVRELVQLHGGSISVQSEEGSGSTFVINLPLTGSEQDTGKSST